jgi:hypothetical protein
MYNCLGTALENFAQTTASDRLSRTYMIQTAWGIENHIRMIMKRAKSVFLIFCEDPLFYEKHAGYISRLVKLVKVNVIISDKKIAKGIPAECYQANRDMTEFLIHLSIAKKYARQTKMIFYADRKEALTVFETGGRNEAVFTANNIYGEFISRIVLRNLIKQTA